MRGFSSEVAWSGGTSERWWWSFGMLLLSTFPGVAEEMTVKVRDHLNCTVRG